MLREHEFARLDIGAADRPVAAPAPSLAPVEKLADGFWSISGAAVDAQGALYFIDRRFQRIHRWSEAKGLEIVRDHPLDPVNLAIDASGHLLVLSSLGPKGAVYSFDPAGPPDALTLIEPTPVRRRAARGRCCRSTGGSTASFATSSITRPTSSPTLAELFAQRGQHAQGAGICLARRQHRAARVPHLEPGAARSCRLALVERPHRQWARRSAGRRTAVRDQRVGERDLQRHGRPRRHADRPEALRQSRRRERRRRRSAAGSTSRTARCSFTANDGKEIGRINVPERPLQILFGGPDRRTLFILTHYGLYAARP